jgi:hypothetical protein
LQQNHHSQKSAILTAAKGKTLFYQGFLFFKAAKIAEVDTKKSQSVDNVSNSV